ncbi:MAG TPA: cytochrome P450 [Allosphingosinicella sp.]|nr:cytochrome P450 [Allosphingosinicella sp.]
MDTPLNGVPPEGKAAAREGAGGAWLVSSYADARAILVSAAARVPADSPPPPGGGGGAADAVVARGVLLRGLWMWGCDTDRRAPCRKAAATALGSAPVERLGPYLESRAADLLDSGPETVGIDLVDGFARPLVRDALMELFGVEPAARAPLQAQVGAMAGFIPGSTSGGTARYFALAATARLLEEIWAKPLPPLAAASRLLRGAVEAGEISLDEALAQATLLLFGNSYTTLDALAGLLARLAEQPLVWQAARSGSLAVAGLVEESLRLGPPAHLILFRDSVGEILCPGGNIPAGARIVLPLDRLNRDPACFERADAFEPGRSGPPHLAFGAGRHMCVGLHLARAVIRAGVEALLRRLPEWPAETRVSRAPGILGGPSVVGLAVSAGALRIC